MNESAVFKKKKPTSSLKMAKSWGQNTSEQQLTNKNIVQQVDVKYYVCNIVAQQCTILKLFL